MIQRQVKLTLEIILFIELDLGDHSFLKVILKALDKLQYYVKVTHSCLLC